MNRKQRRAALKKMTKKAFVDTSHQSIIDEIMSSSQLQSITDPEQYANAATKLIIDNAKAQLNNYINSIKMDLDKEINQALEELGSKFQPTTEEIKFDVAAAKTKE